MYLCIQCINIYIYVCIQMCKYMYDSVYVSLHMYVLIYINTTVYLCHICIDVHQVYCAISPWF